MNNIKNDKFALSIIIPTYNCADFFEDSLNNMLSECPDSCQIILSDDGSSDGTVEILKSFEGKYNNLVIIYNDHRGVSATRNAGLLGASGEYIAFMDCDDCMHKDFLTKERLGFKEQADLYIFGIKRQSLDGSIEDWTIEDKCYPDAAAFADDYVRRHKLLLYSVCNKFYKRALLDRLNLRFEEGMQFGEDRIFNFTYLEECGKIISSSDIMQDYIQRSEISLSSSAVPHYFDTIAKLHMAKMNCILSLSAGTSDEEKREYIAYDFIKEVTTAIDRFTRFPEEERETMDMINDIIFFREEKGLPVGIIIVLGSERCGYKAEKAFERGRELADCHYIVCGGNLHSDKKHSESELMAEVLLEKGAAKDKVHMENASENTRENLIFALEILQKIREENPETKEKTIGIVSAGFHLKRIRALVESIPGYSKEKICYIPAYGASTSPDTWYLNEYGKRIVLGELRKQIIYDI